MTSPLQFSLAGSQRAPCMRTALVYRPQRAGCTTGKGERRGQSEARRSARLDRRYAIVTAYSELLWGITKVSATCATSARNYAEQQWRFLLWRENHYIENTHKLMANTCCECKMQSMPVLVLTPAYCFLDAATQFESSKSAVAENNVTESQSNKVVGISGQKWTS